MILITGATGFVGSYLALKLAEKSQNITAIYRHKNRIQKTKELFDLFDKSHLFDKINWIEADITDIPALEIAFEKIKYVYHCAGLTSFNPDDEKLLRKTNIEGTANIVNISLAKNVQKICFISSIETLSDYQNFGDTGNQNHGTKIITESSEWNPEKSNSDYAISKYGAEMEIWRGQQEGLEVAIVNPGTILGREPKSWHRDKNNFMIISNLGKESKFYPQGATGFVSVDDVALSMIRLMESNISGTRYLLVSENLSFKEILHIIAGASKENPPERKLQKWMLHRIYFCTSIKAILLFQKRTLFRRQIEWLSTTKKFSNEKIKKDLNFTFEPIENVIQKLYADN